MKPLGYVFIAIWFIVLLVGAGSAYALYRLWPDTEIEFVRRTAYHLWAGIIEAITASTLIFCAKGVVFTWTFSTVLFTGAFLRALSRLPLILYVIRGEKTVTLPPVIVIDENKIETPSHQQTEDLDRK